MCELTGKAVLRSGLVYSKVYTSIPVTESEKHKTVQGFAESLQQSSKTQDRSIFGRSSRVVGI